MFFELYTELNLDKFLIKLYKFNTAIDVVTVETIQNMTTSLNTLNIAKEVLEILENLQGITKIQIYDLDNTLLIDSSVAIDNFIN